jgi:hypothetical protein
MSDRSNGVWYVRELELHWKYWPSSLIFMSLWDFDGNERWRGWLGCHWLLHNMSICRHRCLHRFPINMAHILKVKFLIPGLTIEWLAREYCYYYEEFWVASVYIWKPQELEGLLKSWSGSISMVGSGKPCIHSSRCVLVIRHRFRLDRHWNDSMMGSIMIQIRTMN